MTSRRRFLTLAAGAGALLAIAAPALAGAGGGRMRRPVRATAVTRVFGDGVRLVAVALEYPTPVAAASVAAAQFQVQGRTVTDAFVATSTDPADRAGRGRFVIVALSPEDAGAALAEKLPAQAGESGPGGSGGPGNAGDVPRYDTVYRRPQATVVAADAAPLTTEAVDNLVVDAFQALEFHDPASGALLRYNLFLPRGHATGARYPLVLFMHDAGATSDVTRSTLLQGLGAIAWASPEDQAQRPCFVLAPQYAELVADDASHTSGMLDTTIALVKSLLQRYRIDPTRLYATGQSGGCMLAIAMGIKYPEFFAASFLVAGQWDPAQVAPLARQRLWILVSEDDDKAYPGQNAITAVLEQQGAKVARAVWDGTWTPAQFRTACERLVAEGDPINYVAFRKGTVIPPGQSTAGASGHRNTWRIAYTIAPIREWIFRQHR